MTFEEKLQVLRKDHGWSQEQLAAEIGVSRQAISKWESGSVMPDTENVLRLSQLFGVTTDYLLYEEYDSDRDSTAYHQGKDAAKAEQNRRTALYVLIGAQALALFWELVGWIVYQSSLIVLLGMTMQITGVTGFEVGFRRHGAASPEARSYRRMFYRISVWLFAYFPLQMLVMGILRFWPRPYPGFLPEIASLALYLLTCSVITRGLQKAK